ncbi:MAG TPA: hypothetical protein VIO60_05655 [Rectinemataceae bacterium]
MDSAAGSVKWRYGLADSMAYERSVLRTARLVDPAFMGFGHRRARPGSAKVRERGEDQGARGYAYGPVQKPALRILLVLESEGAIFDSPEHEASSIHGPVFESLFSWGAEPGMCEATWREIATRSRWRGESPLAVLKASLARLNTLEPSLRWTAFIRYLEALPRDRSTLSTGSSEAEALYSEWLRRCECREEEAGTPPLVQGARAFLEDLPSIAPEADVLVYSSKPESLALNRWEVAGLGSSFTRLAGSERGSFSEYLYSALEHGYSRRPILVVGTSVSAWKAAQRAQARFYPLVRSERDSSWEVAWSVFRSKHLPEYLHGRDGCSAWPMGEFLAMVSGESLVGRMGSDPADKDEQRPRRLWTQASEESRQPGATPLAESFDELS